MTAPDRVERLIESIYQRRFDMSRPDAEFLRGVPHEYDARAVEALRLMRAVCDAAADYRTAEQDGTPRLWKGKELCDVADVLDKALAAHNAWRTKP